ncbi:MAG: transglutaminase domain-containing protein [Cyanobacteria bacterium SZAS LIN-2]|nr:transglutaminase domain-containing protein [Cyanobacteria bacterium SZAS LIN-2]
MDNTELRVDGDSTIKLLAPLPEKAHYSVTSQIPVYDLEVMRRLPPETLYQLDEDREEELKTAQACLQLPPTLNPKMKDMGADAAGIEGNWFSKAERIAEYVKSHYRYDAKSFFEAPKAGEGAQTSGDAAGDSTSNPASTLGAVTGSLDTAPGETKPPTATTGSAQKPALSELDQFLFERKSGNCRHFASTFVLLCRTQGIPARVVVGFNPGELNKKTGYREIKGKDTHVWAEVYIPYWSWVPFDPTPNGQLPAHQEGGNALTKFISSGLANPFGQNVNQRPHHKPAKTSIGAPDAGAPKPDENKNNGPGLNFDQNKNKPKGSTFQLPWLGVIDQTQMQSVVKLVGAIILFLALLVAVLIYLRQQKTARVKELLGDHPPSTLVFLEVLGELKRYDFNKLPTETADELSDRARSQFAQLERGGRHIPEELPGVVSEFMELYNQERFGGADNLDELHELSQRIKALSSTQTKVRAGK